MANWKETTLGEVLGEKGYIRGPFGSSLRRNELLTEGIPVYEQQNAIYDHREFRYFIDRQKYAEMSRFTIKENDLIVSCSGTLGKISIIKRDDPVGIISQALLILRPNTTQILSKYLYYFFDSAEGFNSLVSRSTGSVQVNIAGRKIIEGIDLFLPPIPEQKAIVAILTSFDDKIELLQQQNKTLESIAQTTFKEWFIKFTVNGKKLKIDNSTGLPEGWRMGKLGDEFEIIMGQSPPGASYNESGEGMIFFQGRAEFQERFPTIRLYTTEPKRIAEKFDVLVSVRAPVGDINVAFYKCCIGRGLGAVRGKYKSYALYKIKSLKGAFHKFEAEGTVFGSIGKDAFSNIEAIIPNKETLKSFEAIVSKIDTKIYNNNSQIQILSKLRDTLLPKLMKGKIRVKI